MPRYILEGEWSGYTSAQRKIVHREVLTAKRAEAFKGFHGILYTDGTMLIFDVREAKLREKVEQVNGYGSLIRSALAYRAAKPVAVVAVTDLPN